MDKLPGDDTILASQISATPAVMKSAIDVVEADPNQVCPGALCVPCIVSAQFAI